MFTFVVVASGVAIYVALVYVIYVTGNMKAAK